jgi:DNA polymerase I-like protein with 3'-5' exonuclease and polymerase domains
MLELLPNLWLVESPSDLPPVPDSVQYLYMDTETSSGHPKKDSLNPWIRETCRAHLFAVTWDDNPNVYAVPRSAENGFVRALLKRARVWVNHHVKYDAHVLHNDMGYGFSGEYHDTLTLAKLVDSDRTYPKDVELDDGTIVKAQGYGLDELSLAFLKRDVSWVYKQLNPYLFRETKTGKKIRINQDYGSIEVDILGRYACVQVQANRDLYKQLLKELPNSCYPVWATEIKQTSVLIDIERRGMRIDEEGVIKAHFKSLYKMVQCKDALDKVIGHKFNPASTDDCYDLFINRYCLPPIYNPKAKSKKPSFDKWALEEYAKMPDAPHELIKLVAEYKRNATLIQFFWEPWKKLAVNGILHSDYNQCVKSGRQSCRNPNAQFFSDEARQMIIPREGYAIVVHDFAQIEYRFIIHYIQNAAAIAAYVENPDVDFHQLVADQNGLLGKDGRDAAKTLNLATGYGMGVGKTIAKLAVNPYILQQTGGDPFLIQEMATSLNANYHKNLPELKRHTKLAELQALEKGFVSNAYGRRCHLPTQAAYRAFNRVCQSHGADLIKERSNALADATGGYGAYLLALVHDEVASEVLVENAERYLVDGSQILNASGVPLRVPVRCSAGISTANWWDAKEDGDRRKKLAPSVAANELGQVATTQNTLAASGA